MKTKKFLNQLEKDIEDKYRKDKVTYFDMIMAPIVFLMFSYEISLSSYKYFYHSFVGYSVLIFLILCVLVCNVIPKRYGDSMITGLYQLLMPLFLLMVSFWVIPKVMHYVYFDKKEICINAKLTYKLSARKDEGMISFDIKYDTEIPRELISFNSISGIPFDNYISLPKIGSKIKICGDISKVGYIYTHIETIEEQK